MPSLFNLLKSLTTYFSDGFPRLRHVEGEVECQYCLCAPCVVSEQNRQMWWPSHARVPHHGNTSARKPLYRRFWAMLYNRGAWMDHRYLDKKHQARGGDITWHRREIMPDCVVSMCRTWFPNPTSVPYMGHMWQ